MAQAPVPLPDPALIPNPAYLVVGAYPSDKPSGRTFWDDPHYYFFDERDVKPETPATRANRYIQGSFHNLISMKRFYYKTLAEKGHIHYIEKFDVVIFDYAVVKFLGKHAIEILTNFLGSVKEGGQLILIDLNPFSYVMGTDTEKKFIDAIATMGFPFRIVSIAESVAENEIAAQVYGAHDYLQMMAASPELRGALPKVVIIDKPRRINAAAAAVAAVAAVAAPVAPAALAAPAAFVAAGGAGGPPAISAGSNAAFSFKEGNSPEQTTSDFETLNTLFESLPLYMKDDEGIHAMLAEVTSIKAELKNHPESIHESYDRLHQIIGTIRSFMENVPRARKSRRRKLSRKTKRQRRRKGYTT